MTKSALLSRATLSAALCVLVLSGCAHTPQAHYYVLSAPPAAASTAGHDSPRIGLGPISLPDYLDRPQIVTRASDSRLTLSNEHRWAEPLTVSFARALAADLQHELPDADIVQHPWRGSLTIARQVRIEVTRFERDANGSFRLSARWSVGKADDSDAAHTQQSDIALPVSGKDEDYDALVATANSAVAALASAIAAQLKTP